MVNLDIQLRKLKETIEDGMVHRQGIILNSEQYQEILNILERIDRIRSIDLKSKECVEISIEELASICGLSATTLMTYCSNYRFGKYIYKRGISVKSILNIDRSFVKLMYEFLNLKYRIKNAEALKAWWNKDRRKV